jgi:UDP-N-acetylmuramyl tripeptide synthase
VINVDDKNLTQFADSGKITGFGLSPSIQPRPSYAINFGPEPTFEPSVEVSKLGEKSLQVKVPERLLSFETKADAPHQALNLAASIAAVSKLIEPDWDLIEKTVSNLPPVFARDEIASVRGKDVRFLLCLNPTSFTHSLSEITDKTNPLMIMAGGDISDPSWLWTVDFSKLRHVDVVGGKNAYDLALRLMYQDVQVDKIILEADKAADAFLGLSGPSPTVLFTADAMRRTRRYLGLAK